MRHPLLVHADELLQEGDQLLSVEGGEGGARGGSVHPRHVHPRAEEPDLVVHASERLHALEQLIWGGGVRSAEEICSFSLFWGAK